MGCPQPFLCYFSHQVDKTVLRVYSVEVDQAYNDNDAVLLMHSINTNAMQGEKYNTGKNQFFISCTLLATAIIDSTQMGHIKGVDSELTHLENEGN